MILQTAMPDWIKRRKRIEHRHLPIFPSPLWLQCDQQPHTPATVPFLHDGLYALELWATTDLSILSCFGHCNKMSICYSRDAICTHGGGYFGTQSLPVLYLPFGQMEICLNLCATWWPFCAIFHWPAVVSVVGWSFLEDGSGTSHRETISQELIAKLSAPKGIGRVGKEVREGVRKEGGRWI